MSFVKAATLGALTVLLSGCAGAADAPTPVFKPLPFFDAFETFCANTGGMPDAAEKAIKLAGGTPQTQTQEGAKLQADLGGQASHWSVTIAGHAMTVGLFMEKEVSAMMPNHPIFGCTISSPTNEDGSVAAIANWVGVPPKGVGATTPLFLQTYQFEVQSDRHIPWDMDAGASVDTMVTRLEALVAGRVWAVTLFGDKDRARVMVLHFLATPPDNSPQK